ncbi:hypothetical protein ACIG54_07100 [Streptomyces achromogenes]|uniref:hypothetical protein n=1 Tax=Streptomyces achromogenes TaxID=67255 RepID=UPI0037CF0B7E
MSILQWLVIWLGIGAVYIFKDWRYGKKKFAELVGQFGHAIGSGTILAFTLISTVVVLIFWPFALAWDIAGKVKLQKKHKKSRH